MLLLSGSILLTKLDRYISTTIGQMYIYSNKIIIIMYLYLNTGK